MRIGVLVEPALPEWGGRYTFQAEVLRAIHAHGAGRGHVFVMLGRWSQPGIAPLPAPHMEYVDIAGSPGALLRARLLKIAETARRLGRPLPHFKVTTLAQRSALAAGVNIVWYLTPNYGAIDLPFVYTVWDLQHRGQPWFPEVSDAGQWAERERQYAHVLPRAAAVITGTEVGKTEIINYYRVPEDHVRVVPFPAPDPQEIPQETSRAVLARHGLTEGYLFYPAQFWPHKNHVLLLLALRLLRDQHGLSLPLVFVGSPTSVRRYIEGVVRSFALEKHVHILGFVSAAERDALYRHALALAMPTFFGPDNLPPLEAFALGCPVITSDVPGAREQLGDAALLADPRDETPFALAIKRLHDDPALRADLVRKGRDRALAWTGRHYIERVLSILSHFPPFLRSWMPNVLREQYPGRERQP